MGLLDMLAIIEDDQHISVGHIISEKESNGGPYKVYTRVSLDQFVTEPIYQVFRVEDCYDIEDILDDCGVYLLLRSEIVETFETETILFMTPGGEGLTKHIN